MVLNWCNQCGLCCQYFDIDVTLREFDAILEVLTTKERKDFLDIVRQNIDENIFHWRNPCPFLRRISENKYECRVEKVKPKMCREWNEQKCKAFLKRVTNGGGNKKPKR